MDITINIDENMFAEVIEKELKSLPPEKLQDIIVSAIQKYFEENGDVIIKNLLLRKSEYGYCHSEPTGFMREIVKNADYSKLNDFVNKSIDLLSTNYNSILKEVLADALISGLTGISCNYRDNLSEAIKREVYRMENN